MEAFVDVLHAFGAVISFGYHFHFYLRAFHTVTLAYHGAEHPVAAEVGISRDEEVAQIDRIDDIPFDGVYYREKAVHLCRVGHDDRLEVVSILQAVADACCNGVDVFNTEAYSMPMTSSAVLVLTYSLLIMSAKFCAFSSRRILRSNK